MNPTKLKYARERLNTIFLSKTAAIRKEGSATKPESTKLDLDAKEDQVLSGAAKFSLAKFKARNRWSRDEVYPYMIFKEDKSGDAKVAAWEKKQTTLLDKMQARHEFIEEELLLGDEEGALKLIRDFAKE